MDDNCQYCYNPDQYDSNLDGIGDVCESGDFDCDCPHSVCGDDPCPNNNEIYSVDFR